MLANKLTHMVYHSHKDKFYNPIQRIMNSKLSIAHLVGMDPDHSRHMKARY